MNGVRSLAVFLRVRVRVFSAVLLRIFASALYLGLLWIVTIRLGAAASAELIYINSLCYVSSSLGRVGADQLIFSHAIHFQHRVNSRGISILITHLLAGGVLVSIAAILLHLTLGLFFTDQMSLPSAALAVIATAFAWSQTCAAAAQARGNPFLAVLVFPLVSWAVLICAALSGTLGFTAYALAFGCPAVAAMVFLIPRLWTSRARPQRRWLWRGRHYYLMGINFNLNSWSAYLYLHALVPAADLVTVNVASRIAALQTMPANAAVSLFQPVFAMNTLRGKADQNERIIAGIVILNIACQLVLIITGAALLILPNTIALDGTSIGIFAAFFISNLVLGLLGPSGPALSMMGAQADLARISTVITLLSVVSGLAATIWLGVLGYASITAFFTVFQGIMYATMLQRRWGINALKRVLLFACGRRNSLSS